MRDWCEKMKSKYQRGGEFDLHDVLCDMDRTLIDLEKLRDECRIYRGQDINSLGSQIKALRAENDKLKVENESVLLANKILVKRDEENTRNVVKRMWDYLKR